MPDWLGGWLTKPKGWPFGIAVTGGAILLGWYLDLAPFNRADNKWLLLAAAALVFGTAVTVVAILASALPAIGYRLQKTLAALRLWNRRRTPVAQLRRLTADEKSALCWLLANEQGVDATMTSPFAGLVASGFLIPQTTHKLGRKRAMLLSDAAIQQKSGIFKALGVTGADAERLNCDIEPWLERKSWLAR